MIKPLNIVLVLQNIYWILLIVHISKQNLFIAFVIIIIINYYKYLIGQYGMSRLTCIATNRKTNGPWRYWFNIEKLRDISGIQQTCFLDCLYLSNLNILTNLQLLKLIIVNK